MFFGNKGKTDTKAPTAEELAEQKRALVEKARQFVTETQTKIDAVLATLEPLDSSAVSSFGQSTMDALNDATEKIMQGLPPDGATSPQAEWRQTGQDVAAAFNNGAVRNTVQAPRPARFTNAMRMM